jgi:hypothetical protein
MMSILPSLGDKDMVEITTLRNSLTGLNISANRRLEDYQEIGKGAVTKANRAAPFYHNETAGAVDAMNETQ